MMQPKRSPVLALSTRISTSFPVCVTVTSWPPSWTSIRTPFGRCPRFHGDTEATGVLPPPLLSSAATATGIEESMSSAAGRHARYRL